MIKITEKVEKNRTIYTKTISTDSLSVSKDITYTVASKIIDGYIYFMIYDSGFTPNSDAFGFLNFSRLKSMNTRKAYAEALRLLFAYEDIVDCKITHFRAEHISGLIEFLAGCNSTSASLTFELLTHRQNGTINQYLAIYREYCRYLGAAEDTYILRKERIYLGHNVSPEVQAEKYEYTLKTSTDRTVPMYVSTDEAKAIVNEIWKTSKTPLRDQIIVALAFDRGLRIGEILGLTADDVLQEYDALGHQYYTAIYLRNRVSDHADQQAKNCMSVASREDYNSSAYKAKGVGWQKICIPGHELLDDINDYIDETHSALRQRDEKKYWGHFLADRVDEAVSGTDGDNFYIFANLHGKRLSQSVWTKQLRKLYSACNIPVDKGFRSHNVTHRLRHGSAMRLVANNVDILKIQEHLRHKRLDSTLIYHRPTDSDIIAAKEAFEADSIQGTPSLAALSSKLQSSNNGGKNDIDL